MPEVVVYLIEGRTLEQKRGLVKDITEALAKNAGSPPEAVTVNIVEVKRENKAKAGKLFTDR